MCMVSWGIGAETIPVYGPDYPYKGGQDLQERNSDNTPNCPRDQWLALGQYIDRTDQGGTRPSLFHLSKRSEKVKALSPRLFTTRRKVE